MTSPAMPGRVMTWREWLDEYDPFELNVGRAYEKNKTQILVYLSRRCNQIGISIGDEWRADDGWWSMRGKAVQK